MFNMIYHILSLFNMKFNIIQFSSIDFHIFGEAIRSDSRPGNSRPKSSTKEPWAPGFTAQFQGIQSPPGGAKEWFLYPGDGGFPMDLS